MILSKLDSKTFSKTSLNIKLIQQNLTRNVGRTTGLFDFILDYRSLFQCKLLYIFKFELVHCLLQRKNYLLLYKGNSVFSLSGHSSNNCTTKSTCRRCEKSTTSCFIALRLHQTRKGAPNPIWVMPLQML